VAIDVAAPPREFEPVAVEPKYGPAPAWVDRDRSKGWIKRMMPILLAHKWILMSGLLCSLGMLGLGVATPRIVMEAIDKAIIQAQRPLVPIIVVLAILGAFRAVLGFVFRYQLQHMSVKIEYDLRTMLYEHFSRLSFGFFDRVQTGQLISRANSDIRAVQMFLSFAPSMSIQFVSFFAAFGLMLSIHPWLALVAITPMPLIYFVGTNMRQKMFPISWLVQARMADVATIVEENVTGVRVVKSFAAEKQQIGLLTKSAQRLWWGAVRQVDVQARFSPLMQNLPRLGQALVLLYGGWLAIKGQVTIGTLVAFNSYVLMLQAPFMMIGFLLTMSNRAAASSQRIFEILDESPEIVDKPGAHDLLEPLGDVEFTDVSFAYAGGAGNNILDRFGLHLWPGETVALVGRTGCGKSTVSRLIPRFYDVRDGSVTVDGVDVRNYTLRSLRSHIGLVLDEPFLFSDSIRDNIAYGRPDATQDEIESVARAAGAHEFIAALPEGYATEVGERGYTLSGGQRQRIAIARTLLVNPRILILDDATSSIDVQLEQEIHEALKTLMRGRTTLIIAHRLSTIALADRVVLMDSGRIIADGTHAELLRTTPLYVEVLAHAEEEWTSAHAPLPDLEEQLPPRMRVMRRMMKEREEQARPPSMDGVSGMPGGIS
jgi:ATP-binding cassette subfamily B protein